jgi:hypothetical protein
MKMHKLMISGVLLGAALQSASAAPVYDCSSQSKKFQISLITDPHQDSFELGSATIAGEKISDATLSMDSGFNNDNGPFSFEIQLPYSSEADEGKVHLLSVQLPSFASTGSIQEKYSDQDFLPLKTLSSEPMNCVQSN